MGDTLSEGIVLVEFTALFSRTLASAAEVVAGADGASVIRKPRQSYDFGSAEAPAATVTRVIKPC